MPCGLSLLLSSISFCTDGGIESFSTVFTKLLAICVFGSVKRSSTALLYNFSAVQYRHFITNVTNDVHFMGDHQDRDAQLIPDFPQEVEHGFGRIRVKADVASSQSRMSGSVARPLQSRPFVSGRLTTGQDSGAFCLPARQKTITLRLLP